MTLANLLGSYGISTVVLESGPALFDLPRAVGTDSDCLRAWQAVGLYENDKMVERIRRWEAPRFYVYQIDLDATEAWIPIEHHVGIFTVASEADGSVCVTWKQYFDPEIPLTGPIVAWVMSRIAHRAFAELSSRFGEGSPSPRACGR